MHFNIKNYLKSNQYHIAKHTLDVEPCMLLILMLFVNNQIRRTDETKSGIIVAH
jgi:hypothetical protein